MVAFSAVFCYTTASIPQKKEETMFTKVSGWIGMLLILTAYFLLANEFIESKSILYHAMNIIGSFSLSIDLARKKAWAGFGLQVVFILIAFWTICRYVLI
jgi:hypothetical protein